MTDARTRPLVALLCAALLGHAQWFLGNLYEAVVTTRAFADDPQPAKSDAILAPGSPVRYYIYIPAAPLSVLATVVAVVIGRGAVLGGGRRADRLHCDAAQPRLVLHAGGGRGDLRVGIARWRRLNVTRLVLVGGTLTALAGALASLLRLREDG